MTRNSGRLSEGTPFSALLNPIRDLAASWGIDVAKELSEYAESLGITLGEPQEGIEMEDECTVPVDFAQAALLVQGSTSIYSRKVEHLYSLVYIAVSAMNQIRSKSKSGVEGGSAPAHSDADADALLDVDEDDFLTLDDDIPQADPKSITLRREPRPGIYFRDETRLPPVPPMLAHSSTDPANATPFKIATARTHPSGALIMDGCPPLNEDLDTLPVADEIDLDINITQPFGDDSGPELDIDDGDGFLPAYASDSEVKGQLSSHAQDGRPSVTGSQAIRDTAALYGFTSSGRTENCPKPRRDPFLMLDPHQAFPTHDRPTKVGKTYKKPRKAVKKLVNVYYEVAPSEMKLEDLVMSKLPPNASIKSYLSCPALQSHYKSMCRKRRAHQRKAAHKDEDIQFEDTIDGYEVGFENDDGVDVDTHAFEGTSGFAFEDDDVDSQPAENLRLSDSQREDFVNGDCLDHLHDGKNVDQLGSHFAYIASSFEETCRKHLEKTAWMWEQRTTDINLVTRVEEWTSRIRPLLEEEDLRPEFDISLYGRAILSDFDGMVEHKESAKARISKLFQQTAKFEVCRKFLATLQLANNHAIEIISPEGCTVEDFFVRLPSSEKENREPAFALGEKIFTSGDNNAGLGQGQGGGKRLREPGSTPKSARRQPLRPRLQLLNSAE